jgi:sugar phosphate isomerase/epimerase
MKPFLLPIIALTAMSAAPQTTTLPPIPAECRTGGFAIGCQAYTFNRFTAFEAIEMTAQAGGKVIEFYPGQRLSPEEPDLRVGHDASDEVVTKLQEKLAKHDVHAVNYGVVGIPNDEAGARKVFEFAKKMGIRAVTTESTESIDVIEKLVKEFNIGCGYHNHPRRLNNPGYQVWDPNYIAELVKDRDPRIGACADTGHWTRSGIVPVEALKILEGRIISAHLKDLNEFGERGAHDVPFGSGVSGIAEVLDELKRQGFSGNLSIEYEHNWEHSLPEVAQCVGFVRGYGARH